jgi:hypothetical protein
MQKTELLVELTEDELTAIKIWKQVFNRSVLGKKQK